MNAHCLAAGFRRVQRRSSACTRDRPASRQPTARNQPCRSSTRRCISGAAARRWRSHRQTSVFTAEELITEMDAAGVHGAVLHPPTWDPGSNEMAVEAARKYPDKFCSLGWFPLDDPKSSALMDTWKQRPGMVGLRWALVRPEQQTWHEDGTMDWVWPAAERAGLPVATMAGRFLPTFRRIAEQHPDLRLLIDHLVWCERRKGRRGIRRFGRAAAAGEAAERRDEGDRRARLSPPRIRSATSMTGCTVSSTSTARSAFSGAPTSPACRVAIGMRDDVHRRTALAEGARSGTGDGPGRARVVAVAVAPERESNLSCSVAHPVKLGSRDNAIMRPSIRLRENLRGVLLVRVSLPDRGEPDIRRRGDTGVLSCRSSGYRHGDAALLALSTTTEQ